MKNELTALESDTLHHCEEIIEKTKGAFVKCGSALAKIHHERLYRQEYKNFNEYCKARWGWTRQRAHQMIEAAETVNGLSEKCQPLVDTERKARLLSSVPIESRNRIMESAGRNGSISLAIKEAKKDAERLDETGFPIPKSVIADWDYAQNQSHLVSRCSEIKCAVENALKDENVVFSEIKNDTLTKIKHIYLDLKRVVPYAVCPTCNGSQKSKCALCGKRGFISKFLWDTCVPEEAKKIRFKMVSK